MNTSNLLILPALSLLLAQGSVSAEPQPDDAKPQTNSAASMAVNAFLDALIREDLDAIMSQVTVPWCDREGVIESKVQVRAWYRTLLSRDDLSKAKVELLQIERYDQFRARCDTATARQLDAVVDSDDLIFLHKAWIGEKSAVVGVFVRPEGEKARLIGFR